MANNRLTSKSKIKDILICKKCPIRLYQKTEDNLKYGKGNMFPEYIFVLPNFALQNKTYENLLNDICKDILNIEEQYITYHPKCLCYNIILHNCDDILLHEIRKLNPKKIIFFGVDIPKKLLENSNGILLYRFYNIWSAIKDSNNLNKLRENLKSTL